MRALGGASDARFSDPGRRPTPGQGRACCRDAACLAGAGRAPAALMAGRGSDPPPHAISILARRSGWRWGGSATRSNRTWRFTMSTNEIKVYDAAYWDERHAAAEERMRRVR